MRLFVLLSLIGCAHWFPPPPLAPGERFVSRWVGRSEDDVLLAYGTPSERIAVSTGNVIDSYHRETAQSSSRVAVYEGAGGGSSQSSTVFCDRRFEIDWQTKKVVRAFIGGSACNFDL